MVLSIYQTLIKLKKASVPEKQLETGLTKKIGGGGGQVCVTAALNPFLKPTLQKGVLFMAWGLWSVFWSNSKYVRKN